MKLGINKGWSVHWLMVEWGSECGWSLDMNRTASRM